MAFSEVAGLTVVAGAAVLAPLLATATGRLAVPGVVLEILAGVLIGPEVLGWVAPAGAVVELASFGLALLMFLAGFECDPAVLRGRPLALAGLSWLGSFAVAGAAVTIAALSGHGRAGLLIAMVCCTTALGVLLPVLQEGGTLQSPLGTSVLAVGSVGEFAPIVLIALVLGGHDPVNVLVVLAFFAVVVALMLIVAGHPRSLRFRVFAARYLHSPSQLPVRLSMLVITAFVLLANELGIDALLGSFAAGVMLRIAGRGLADHRQEEELESKMQAIGFGFLIPVFFVLSGMRLDFQALFAHPALLTVVPGTLLALLAVRGLPTYLVFRRLDLRSRCALAFFAATALPLVVVITTLGATAGDISTGVAAALVTGALASVLIFPAVGRSLLTGGAGLTAAQPSTSG